MKDRAPDGPGDAAGPHGFVAPRPRPWSPSAAREAVREAMTAALDAGLPRSARGYASVPEEAYASPESFASYLRAHDLHSETLLSLAEAAGAPKVSHR